MVDFQKDETKLRAKAKKGTITDEEFFKEMKRLHKRATESIVIEDNKILLDTPYGYKQISSIEDDVAYLYDGAVVQLTPEEIDEISGNTIEEEIDVGQVFETRRFSANDYYNMWQTISVKMQQDILDHIGDKGFDYEEDGKMIKLSWAEADWNDLPLDLQSKIKPYLRSMKAGIITKLGEAGTSAGAKKAWDTRGRGRKAEDEPINPYPKGHSLHDDAEKNPNAYGKHQDSHIASYDMKNEEEQDFLNKQAKSIYGKGKSQPEEDDPDDTRPVGADGQRLGKSDEDWEKEGYDVQIDRSMGTIAITKNGEDVWFSQSHEDNVAMFGDDWDNWDSQLILNTLEGGGQVGEWDSQLDSGYDPSTGDKKEEPDGNKQKELETHKQEREKGSSHTDLTLQKKWLKSPEDVERATDEEIFALANGDQMNKAQNPDGINRPPE